MPPVIALILCVGLVTVLLLIERKNNTEASWALWVPTFWMLICGSRPVGQWFGYGQFSPSESEEAGSPLDRLVLSILILLALLIISRRKIEWSRILKDNLWLIFLYLYLAFSILWSDYPYISFKRWIRLSGAILIALAILSERSPLKALESVLRRSAYVLIPFSLLTIKYFPLIGVEYDRWTGVRYWVGVSSQKNGLGMICAYLIFLIIWAGLRQWRSGGLFKSRSQTFADALVAGIGFHIIRGPGITYSATSIAVLVVGIGLLVLFYRGENLARWMAGRLKAVVATGIIIYVLFSAELLPMVTSFLGRGESLTGRTDIWRAVLDIASRNPLLGVGYGGFWYLKDDEIASAFGVHQAHNGYLGVYLEVGIVGVVLLAAFLLSVCGKVRRKINYTFDWGLFGICFLLMVLLYNYSEATFLRPDFLWTTMVFMTIAFSGPSLDAKGT